jgi:hypothetical protein
VQTAGTIYSAGREPVSRAAPHQETLQRRAGPPSVRYQNLPDLPPAYPPRVGRRGTECQTDSIRCADRAIRSVRSVRSVGTKHSEARALDGPGQQERRYSGDASSMAYEFNRFASQARGRTGSHSETPARYCTLRENPFPSWPPIHSNSLISAVSSRSLHSFYRL